MTTITVSSSMLIPTAKSMRLKPSQVSILWEVAHELDQLRFKRKLPKDPDASVWLTFESKRLRNPEGKKDNWRLKQWLDELQTMQLEGLSEEGDPWAGVIIGQYRFKNRGSTCELMITPIGRQTVLAPKIFAKIEIEAKYRLKGAAKLLYASLADKKRMNDSNFDYDLDDLHRVCQCTDKYPKWYDFNRYVIKPAVKQINEFGTVKVTYKPIKLGNTVVKVGFEWAWKSLNEAEDTSEANDNHSSARGKTSDGTAPPLTDKAQAFIRWQKENPGASYGEYVAYREAQNATQG